MRRALVICAAALASLPATAQAADTPGLRVGAGRADLTALTGGFKAGWACTCARAFGQHTRLFARALVLEQGEQKLALVNVDLGAISAEDVAGAAAMLGDLGFSQQNILVSATHTHGSAATGMPLPKPGSELDLLTTGTDPALGPFIRRQLAASIRRADADLAPGAVGWGHTELFGATRNRSLEAHLANFGLDVRRGAGKEHQDPLGYAGTIDPSVDVLRVDKRIGRRRVPIGMFSTFANHGTAVHAGFAYFTADHSGVAERVVESTIRRDGRVPAGQEVVNAFGNGAEGDMSSALDDHGPAHAERVGRMEARAMLAAWRQAGRRMTRTPVLDRRWTRVCFCGQDTALGPVDSVGFVGLGGAAGSEELRTAFQDASPADLEDRQLPVGVGPQGRKILVGSFGDARRVVSLIAIRIGDQLIVSLPGEMTVEMGRRVRESVRAASAGTIERVVLAGLANSYLNYFTTPEEYERQHFEGGLTLFGRFSSLLVQQSQADLAAAMAAGRPAPAPHDQDAAPATGDARFAPGTTTATATDQPRDVARLQRASFAWRGAPNGRDRPLDTPFVLIQRRKRSGWRTVADDLGLQIAWRVDDDGNHRAEWEVPRSARRGEHRFVITAQGYRLVSEPFRVARSEALSVDEVTGPDGRAAVRLLYPRAHPDRDLTFRPEAASGGRVEVVVDGRRRTVRQRRGSRFVLPAGRSLVVPAGGARDRYGNTNTEPLDLDAPGADR